MSGIIFEYHIYTYICVLISIHVAIHQCNCCTLQCIGFACKEIGSSSCDAIIPTRTNLRRRLYVGI